MTKASDVFVNSVLGLFSKLITQLTYIGVGLIVLLLAVYLYRPSMYHEEKIHKFQWVKNNTKNFVHFYAFNN